MKILSTFGIRLEKKTTPVYETRTEQVVVNVTKSVILQDGTPLDILTPETQENTVQIQISENIEDNNVIFSVFNNEDSTIEHKSYNPTLADYNSLKQDFSSDQVDHLVSLAGWQIELLN